MRATTHALAGGLAGALIGRPWWGLVAGMVSHAVLDFAPHRDDARPVEVIVDACATLAVVTLAGITGHASMAAGMIGGVIPDIENVPEVVFKRARGAMIFPSHWRRHRSPKGRGQAIIEPAVFVAAAVGLVIVALRTGVYGVLR